MLYERYGRLEPTDAFPLKSRYLVLDGLLLGQQFRLGRLIIFGRYAHREGWGKGKNLWRVRQIRRRITPNFPPILLLSAVMG